MSKQKTIEDYGIKIGELPKGKLNKITDVKGLKVGHCTIDNDENKTGVTVILPTEENIYLNKLVAATYVLNGYGKTIGLVQIDELGSLESIIALTNTLNVGLVHDAVVDYMIELCKKDNVELKTINPLICECNDSYLNNIQIRAVKKEHVYKAIENACIDFDQGDIGAGKGMSCHQLKGGIGTASRIITIDGQTFTLGVLVLSNHGRLKDFIIDGEKIGKRISKENHIQNSPDKGSIISIIATDLPLSSRQLRRVAKRAGVGLARLGSYIGHGSGEIMVAFSTGNILKSYSKQDIINMQILNEEKLDIPFRAVAECEEEAILNSMIACEKVIDGMGNTREILRNFIKVIK